MNNCLQRACIAFAVSFCLLFSQLALAAYACPAMAPSMQFMPGCAGMDQAQPALCHAYHHADPQSYDAPDLPQVTLFQPTQLVMLLAMQSDTPHQPTHGFAIPPRSGAPPLLIEHCCFRI
ncbi:hypothetical protein RCH09_001693 [Actimicrobium sp. GrIS 1.19]|uniref:hypothetical protein n=1 Tax=Actimicrobium sp. GrIS 1.19 TaxID=3071708 RepID=UPI002DFD7E68|nr:hypothetical protein [Actimicrobium sp. GrIS 1.19]